MEIRYRGTTLDLNDALVSRLVSMGVTVDEEYLDLLRDECNPIFSSNVSLLMECDVENRNLHSGDTGFGKVIAYLDEPRPYGSLYDAIADNWDERPEMGFERLHEVGITPEPEFIERFGVRMRVPYVDVRIRSINALAREIYRYKDGATWRRVYAEHENEPSIQQLGLDGFLHRMARSRAFMLGDEVARELERHKTRCAAARDRDESTYRDALSTLLDRYSGKDGETAFEEVVDLNDYDGHTGVYVLSLDAERQYYVGMTGSSLKGRIMEHFRRPNSDFDRDHTFGDVTSIHFIHVYDEWFGLRDRVEADCIATLGPESVCNALASSEKWVERQVRMMNNYKLLDPRFPGGLADYYLEPDARDVHSGAYDQQLYQMSDDEVRRVVSDVNLSRRYDLDKIEARKAEAAAKRLRNSKRNRITYETCMLAVRHDGLSLEFVPGGFKTQDVCGEAVRQDGAALEFVPEGLRSPELCLQAIASVNDPARVYGFIPAEYVDEGFALELVKRNRRVTKCLPKEVKTDRVMVAAGYKRRRRA